MEFHQHHKGELLLALRGVMQSDPDKGVPIIEKMLAGGASPRVRDRALFVLSRLLFLLPFAPLLAILVAAGVYGLTNPAPLPRDMEDRTLYTILSKPVPRFEYLIGKLLGVLLLIGIVSVLFYLNVRLAALTLSVVVVLLVVRIYWLPLARRAFVRARQTSSIVNGALAENINGRSSIGLSDVTPVALLLNEYVGFAVKADSRIKSGRDRMALLKADTTSVSAAMSGEVVLMALVGGLGTITGPIVGAFIIITMQNYLASFGEFVLVIQGAIFVVIVMAFRRGLVGEVAAFWKSRRNAA